MTKPSAKVSRIHRMRAIEHRIASAKSARAQAALSGLLQVSQRLATLKLGLNPLVGESAGAMLRSNAELLIRLQAASASIENPICEAQRMLLQSKEIRIRAQQQKDSTAKLLDKATTAETAAHTLRADANRPFRRPRLQLGEDT
jgi:hypothetical protein